MFRKSLVFEDVNSKKRYGYILPAIESDKQLGANVIDLICDVLSKQFSLDSQSLVLIDEKTEIESGFIFTLADN